ncbi:hypothetical protein DPM13_16230 [Paracoccus mutanolyticus]|uniref:Uncharacterized protein n=1 Tax=Paracoccus mutanolyticus TaxID=1499308 RepID=A0ABM6WU14_9RHOB|nr:hypothetical protein DPM13_16230 [Paracoccus mutanolyticus]
MTPSQKPHDGGAVLHVLIGCETSGVMRRAFAALGHDAWSCDLLPEDDGSNRSGACASEGADAMLQHGRLQRCLTCY